MQFSTATSDAQLASVLRRGLVAVWVGGGVGWRRRGLAAEWVGGGVECGRTVMPVRS
tara:strand:+ start:3485 stop:3655 length:171 start_codon:yes stop_codon:yes gene_type:complete